MKINITFQKDDPNLHEKLNRLIREIERGVKSEIDRIEKTEITETHIHETTEEGT